MPIARIKKRRRLFWMIGCCLALGVIASLVILLAGNFIARETGVDSTQSGQSVIGHNPDNRMEPQAQEDSTNPSMEIHDSERISRITKATDRWPDWLPIYPSAESTGTFGVQAEESESGSAAFKTGDSVETVTAFYEKALKALGFEINKKVTPFPGHGAMIMLIAENEGTQQTIHVTAARAEEITTINLVFVTRKLPELSGSDDMSAGKPIMKAQAISINEAPKQSDAKAKE